MAIFQSTFSIAGANAVDGVLFNLKAPAAVRPILVEVGIFLETLTSNAPQFGLKRMSAIGTGAITNGTVFLDDTNEPAPGSALETAWATLRPTVVGGSARRTMVPLALGNGVIWDFRNQSVILPVSSGLCGVMLNASGVTLGVIGGYVLWRE